MFRPSAQSLLRTSASAATRRQILLSTRRCLSTAPPHKKSRSFKSSAARWGIAIAGVWWYTTSPVFAESPQFSTQALPTIEQEDEKLHTIDELAAARRARRSAASEPSKSIAAELKPSGEPTPPTNPDGVEALEEEADSQGAFNPETGEINWDCPCLGGMAHGPCGPEFRAAFSCFVYSKEEPKGMDCVDRFRGMQDCFRLHPDIYGEELAEDEDDDPDRVPLDGPSDGEQAADKAVTKTAQSAGPSEAAQKPARVAKISTPPAASNDGPNSGGADTEGELVPRAWHDERKANATESPPSTKAEN